MGEFGALRGVGPGAKDRWWDLRALRFELDDGTGIAITTGAKSKYQTVTVDLTPVMWRLMANTSATISLDVWADVGTVAAFPPTVADTMVGAEPPALTAAVFAESTRLTGWRGLLEAGMVLEVSVTANDNAVRAVLELLCLPA